MKFYRKEAYHINRKALWAKRIMLVLFLLMFFLLFVVFPR